LTTRTRTRTKTTTTTITTPPTEETIVEASAEELRRQVANADQAMKSLDLRIEDAQALMASAHQSVEDIVDAQNARRRHIQGLQEEDGRLSLELADLAVDVAITESGTTVRGMKKRNERRLDIATEIRQATTEDTRLRKEEAKELAQIESGNVVVEAERNQLLTQRAVFEGKREAIYERLGQAIYREGGEKLGELARSRRDAALDERHYQEEEARARQALKLALSPWYSLRQRAIQEFHLDQKAPDGTTRIILGLIALLDTLEQDGANIPMLLDAKPLATQLSPLDGNALRSLIGPNVTADDLDRRNFFNQRRSHLQGLLEKHNSGRR
jgi:hypothetical protein